MIKLVSKKFTSQDIINTDNGYIYTFQHNLGTNNVIVTILDNSGNIINSSQVFQIAPNYVSVTLPNNSIFGKYTINVYYYSEEENTELAKKRLFEQPLIDDDLNNYLDYRVAIGKNGYPTQNITLSDLRSNIATQNLPYLSNNPQNWQFTSSDAANARIKIGSPDTIYVNNLFASCMPIYGLVDSVSQFIPSATPLANTPSVTTVQCTSGVQCLLRMTFERGECEDWTNIGHFTVNGFSGLPIASSEYVYNDMYLWLDTLDGFMIGTGSIRLNCVVNETQNTITVNVNVRNGIWGDHTINNQIGVSTLFIPIYYNQD